MSTTPVPRPEQTPATPGPLESAEMPVHLEPSRDLGWVVVLLGALGVLIASWTLFPSDGSDGMWASYWVTLFGMLALLAASWLRSSLPPMPGLALTGVCAIGLILTGALHDYSHVIRIPMLVGGIAIGLGAALQATGQRD